MKGGGYTNKDFWSDEGRKWLEYKKADQPELWNDRKWKCPNAPVVGVTWYETYAFTQWLTVKSDDGYKYRLPDENEWEAVASCLGFDGKRREYPWGNDWDGNKCNNGETTLNRTSTVGIFQKGNTPEPECVSDLSGNVWEWTTSDYHSKNLLNDFLFDEDLQKLWDEGKHDKFSSKQHEKNRELPVLRGGSWGDISLNCRCAYRYLGYLPGSRSVRIGFRCART